MNIIKKGISSKMFMANGVEQYRGSIDEDKLLVAVILKTEKPTTEEHIERIIGNNSWTRNICNECGNDSEITVQLGEEPDYDSATAKICPECLKKALSLCYS